MKSITNYLPRVNGMLHDVNPAFKRGLQYNANDQIITYNIQELSITKLTVCNATREVYSLCFVNVYPGISRRQTTERKTSS